MLYEVSSEPIDYAEETGSVVVHFTKEGKPVLLEIMDASKFLAETARARQKSCQAKELNTKLGTALLPLFDPIFLQNLKKFENSKIPVPRVTELFSTCRKKGIRASARSSQLLRSTRAP